MIKTLIFLLFSFFIVLSNSSCNGHQSEADRKACLENFDKDEKTAMKECEQCTGRLMDELKIEMGMPIDNPNPSTRHHDVIEVIEKINGKVENCFKAYYKRLKDISDKREACLSR